jgi:hypothetical protein
MAAKTKFAAAKLKYGTDKPIIITNMLRIAM